MFENVPAVLFTRVTICTANVDNDNVGCLRCYMIVSCNIFEDTCPVKMCKVLISLGFVCFCILNVDK